MAQTGGNTGRLSGPRTGKGFDFEGLGPVVTVLVAVHVAALLFWIVSRYAISQHTSALGGGALRRHRWATPPPPTDRPPSSGLQVSLIKGSLSAKSKKPDIKKH